MNDDPWARWRAARPPTDLLHLDSAAVGRASSAVLEAVAAHALLESQAGGYVAEQLAAPATEQLRRDLAALVGTDADGIAFTEGAMASLEALLRSWPLPQGARMAVSASEWGPNLEAVEARGISVEPLPVDGRGVIDLSALARALADDPPDVVLVDHVAAHRGLVQPAAEIIELGRRHGVPVWLDAAQSLGHMVVPAGAAAVVATSRKWLAGPRGVGVLAVAAEHRPALRVRRPAKHPDRPVVGLLEPDEAHVAGRVGLGVAVGDYLRLGPVAVETRLIAVGRAVREMAETLPGWEVAQPDAPSGAIVALRPTRGQDVAASRDRLLQQHRILTTVCQTWRAPREMTGRAETWLRLSPHVDLSGADLERAATALEHVAR